MPAAEGALRKGRLWLVLAVVSWLGVVGAGTALLARYKFSPGEPANAPKVWPTSDAPIARESNAWTLIMLAHPQCPCTAASMAELAKLAERVGRRVSIHILFILPEGTPRDWEDTPLWDKARSIPGAVVSSDPGGVAAARLGAATSGQVLLYGPEGELRFEGGITGARGHEGDNAGEDRILALVNGGEVGAAEAPVFGCPLRDPEGPTAAQ